MTLSLKDPSPFLIELLVNANEKERLLFFEKLIKKELTATGMLTGLAAQNQNPLLQLTGQTITSLRQLLLLLAPTFHINGMINNLGGIGEREEVKAIADEFSALPIMNQLDSEVVKQYNRRMNAAMNKVYGPFHNSQNPIVRLQEEAMDFALIAKIFVDAYVYLNEKAEEKHSHLQAEEISKWANAIQNSEFEESRSPFIQAYRGLLSKFPQNRQNDFSHIVQLSLKNKVLNETPYQKRVAFLSELNREVFDKKWLGMKVNLAFWQGAQCPDGVEKLKLALSEFNSSQREGKKISKKNLAQTFNAVREIINQKNRRACCTRKLETAIFYQCAQFKANKVMRLEVTPYANAPIKRRRASPSSLGL